MVGVNPYHVLLKDIISRGNESANEQWTKK